VKTVRLKLAIVPRLGKRVLDLDRSRAARQKRAHAARE
jgi:hypothetical protein